MLNSQTGNVTDSSSEDESEHLKAVITQESREAKKWEVSIDHDTSLWEDHSSSQSFVSIVLFLPSGVQASSVQLHVTAEQNALIYTNDRPLPARDRQRLCSAWTNASADGTPPKFQPYNPFVEVVPSHFSQFRHRENEIIQSEGGLALPHKITVVRNLSEFAPLKFSAEQTSDSNYSSMHFSS